MPRSGELEAGSKDELETVALVDDADAVRQRHGAVSQPASCGPGGHRNDPTADPVPDRPPDTTFSDNNTSPLDRPLDPPVKYTK